MDRKPRPGASADDLRRRVAGWQALADRERQLQRDEPVGDAELSFAQALELCELVGDELLASADALRQREVEQARSAWARLRAGSSKQRKEGAGL